MSTVRETFGLVCPCCGDDDRLLVEVDTLVRLLPDGTESIGDEEWSQDSYCACETCRYSATVREFTDPNGGHR